MQEYQDELRKDKGDLFPLRIGSENEYVRVLHSALNAIFKGNADAQVQLYSDLFDENTAKSVRRYYERIGRKSDGGVSEFILWRILREAHLMKESTGGA